jgi:uncharacterized membrane protein YkvA (DUF1232 family)
MDKKQKDFYIKLRGQIKEWLAKKADKNYRWSEIILLAPDLFHLLCKLTIDSRVPANKKVKLGVVIAYFISPLDLLPEAILGPIGYLDDIALTAYVLNDLINDIDAKIVTENWAGDKDILTMIKTILINSDKMLGSGLVKKIRKMF